jgi:two-component system, NarL family, sensor kinase
MTSFVRNYSIASLAAMILAAAAMFTIYRSIVIGSIEAIAETSSVTTARMALYPIRAQLAGYVEAANLAANDPTAVKMPEALQDAIVELTRDSRVARVKIYNRNGVVIFSTRREQIGNLREANPGFAKAMAGKVSVQIIYRDTFNTFDEATEEDNLVQTYFPVRGRPTTPVVGVFELYADVNSLVVEAERSQLRMLAGTVLVLAFMYGALLLLVHQTHREIEEHQNIIAEKNAMLEQLSRENVSREEYERKKFATELHEGLAQSLSAVKLALENVNRGAPAARSDALGSIIPELQSAIGHARAIAVGLSPPSLEDLGLGPTVRTLCNQFTTDHRSVQVDLEVAVEESAIPAPLKTTVYRILATVLVILGSHPEATRVQITLQSSSRALTLVVEDNARVLVAAAADVKGAGDPHSPFGAARERVIVSGGALSVIDHATGAPALRASWLL